MDAGGRGGAGGVKDAAPPATPELGSAPASPDAASASTPDVATSDGPAAKPEAGGGDEPLPPGEKRVAVLHGAAADLKNSTTSMLAILAAMKDSDGIVVEKMVDATTTPAMVAGKALVIIGPNSEAYMGKVNAGLKDVAVPILVSKDHLGPTLAIAGTFDDHTANDQTIITITDAAHPLAAGLPAGDVRVYVPGNRVITGPRWARTPSRSRRSRGSPSCGPSSPMKKGP